MLLTIESAMCQMTQGESEKKIEHVVSRGDGINEVDFRP